VIKYYELASQVLSLYEDVLNFKENEDLLHELLEVCLEDVNLDQLTNIYRFSADDSALGYDMADVGEFVIQFKQTYPKPLDISHLISTLKHSRKLSIKLYTRNCAHLKV
jgi:heme oxygenase